MKETTMKFLSAEAAHARVNQLEAELGLPLSAEAATIDESWTRIEQLEAQTPTKAKPAATARPTANERPLLANGQPLTGLARAMQANQRLQPNR